MTGWAAKRFWKQAEVQAAEHGYEVTLDGRKLRTPSKAELILPTQKIAEEVCKEWQAQDEQIDPETMPYTRSANTAIDTVQTQREAIVDLIAEYGGSDLICYRAEAPEELIARQAEAWDPLLEFAAKSLHAPLIATAGIMHQEQARSSLQKLHGEVARLDAFELTAFHDLVSLSGSLIIALAVTHRFASGESLWRMSRIDEEWQQEQWGEDSEAISTAEKKRNAFLHAERFFFAAKTG